MTPRDHSVFEARRSFRRIWILMAGFGVFIPIGLVIYFISGDPAALIMVAFGVLPVLYLLYRVVSPGSGYSIRDTEVVLKNGRSKRTIPLSEIKGAAVLSQKQTQEILEQYMAPAVEGERELNMKQWYRSSKAYGEFTRYSTVPIVQEHTSAGHSRNIVKFGAKVGGKFVMLKLRSGEEFLISPIDSDAFFRRLAGVTQLRDTSPSTNYVPQRDVTRTKKLRNFFKWYRIIGISAAVIVMAVLTYLNLQQNPPDEPPQTEPPVRQEQSETGWIDADTFRFPVRAQVELGDATEEKRRKELTLAVAETYHLNFISQVIAWYSKETGGEPSRAEHDAFQDALIDMISGIEPEVLSSTFNNDTTQLHAVMEITLPDFQDKVINKFDEGREATY